MSLINREDVDHVMMPPDPNRPVSRDTRVSYFLTPEGAASLIQCPYDKSHWLMPHRLGVHLLKCRRNYQKGLSSGTIKLGGPGEELVVCKWNSLHHIQAKVKKHHEEEDCDSNQDKIDADKIRGEIEMSKLMKYIPGGKMPVSWELHLTAADKTVFDTFKKTPGKEGDGDDDDKEALLGVQQELKKAKRMCNERGLTEEQMKDPNENWEICPIVLGNLERAKQKEDETLHQKCGVGSGEDVVKFVGYDPRIKAESMRTVLFNNPQGLTKSEKRVFHEKTEELRLAKMRKRDGLNVTTSLSALNRNHPEPMERLSSRHQNSHFRPAAPGFPGYELNLNMEKEEREDDHENNN